ncbi:16S rRNA (cytosine(1402)-N(4))-methyltransferase RsmH [Alicyclobacillus cycloheptanicus]|nr:16S rRNA (cytosine(1402)-N(4))-methyltransferase RsmH [Alicyclobacillus cycloheptanicus]WDM02791.1 16S rRNA (cytosine(1402)-N(4))-methyltransferase RsmH [Alicyclobacillus cycloheptanicus]
MKGLSFHHRTVLLHETVEAVRPRDGGKYVDCTLGGAGHTTLLLEQSAPTGRVLAMDQDETAILHAAEALSSHMHRLVLVRSNFREIRRICAEQGFEEVDGVVFDLGVSSPQFDEASRGFSYKHDAPLDMRMDRSAPRTAADLVNDLSEEELADILFRYGEERFSRRIVSAIARERQRGRIETTGQLAEIVVSAIPAAARRTGPHPARRTFQALRIAVNDELGALQTGLQEAFEVLAPGGRMAVITFHSLEDRIVKHTFQSFAEGCICPPDFPVCRCGRVPRGTVVTRKPIVPSAQEVQENPRSRSAKLRVVEKR